MERHRNKVITKKFNKVWNGGGGQKAGNEVSPSECLNLVEIGSAEMPLFSKKEKNSHFDFVKFKMHHLIPRFMSEIMSTMCRAHYSFCLFPLLVMPPRFNCISLQSRAGR